MHHHDVNNIVIFYRVGQLVREDAVQIYKYINEIGQFTVLPEQPLFNFRISGNELLQALLNGVTIYIDNHLIFGEMH